jgi:hypothetical protein
MDSEQRRYRPDDPHDPHVLRMARAIDPDDRGAERSKSK